jgi:hypothetical protein
MDDESEEAEGLLGGVANARQILIDLGWTEDEFDNLESSNILKHARNRTPPPPMPQF